MLDNHHALAPFLFKTQLTLNRIWFLCLCSFYRPILFFPHHQCSNTKMATVAFCRRGQLWRSSLCKGIFVLLWGPPHLRQPSTVGSSSTQARAGQVIKTSWEGGAASPPQFWSSPQQVGLGDWPLCPTHVGPAILALCSPAQQPALALKKTKRTQWKKQAPRLCSSRKRLQGDSSLMPLRCSGLFFSAWGAAQTLH